MPGLAPRGPHATIGVSIQPTNTAFCQISLGQLCAKSRPSAANCSTSLMVAVLTTRTISMKATAYLSRLFLPERSAPRGSLGLGLRQDGERGLSPRIGNQ